MIEIVAAVFIELDAHDLITVDAQTLAPEKSPLSLEFDDAVADADEIAA